jgi:hypothetical protein
MIKWIRWVLFLPVAILGSAWISGVVMIMLEKISRWPISYLFPGFIVETISGIVAGVGIVSIGLWLCPSRTEKTKKVLLCLTTFIGIAASLGSLVDTSDQNNLILNIIMSLTPVFLWKVPHERLIIIKK